MKLNDFKPGDLLDWKREGTAGSFRCRVVRVTPHRLRVKVLSHDGKQYSENVSWETSITTRGVLRRVSYIGARIESASETPCLSCKLGVYM